MHLNYRQLHKELNSLAAGDSAYAAAFLSDTVPLVGLITSVQFGSVQFSLAEFIGNAEFIGMC